MIAWVVKSNGLPNATVVTGRQAQVPGFFRPTKTWDLLIFDEKKLVAAIELKSIADSIGKNSNNRNEEVLGSGVDIKEAFEENAFEGLTRLFTGYLILVEDCKETLSSVKIQMKNFRVMEEFMLNPENRVEEYIRGDNGYFPSIDGVSYMKRFDILCHRLMQKQMYSGAAVVTSPRSAISDGQYGDCSNETSIRSFLVSLASHTEMVAAIRDQ